MSTARILTASAIAAAALAAAGTGAALANGPCPAVAPECLVQFAGDPAPAPAPPVAAGPSVTLLRVDQAGSSLHVLTVQSERSVLQARVVRVAGATRRTV